MEGSRPRRPGIQTQSQTTKITLGNSQPVLRAELSAPLKFAGNLAINSATQLARQQPIDMSLPGENSPLHTVKLKTPRWRRARRNLTRGLAVVMAILIIFGGLLFSQSYLKLHKVFRGGTATAAALKPNVTPDQLKGEGSGRVNILLLGRGGGNHSGPDLTDSIMLVSIDPINHTASLISIPRDLWVNVPSLGDMKINAAWQSGEFSYEGKNVPGSTDPKAIGNGFKVVDQVVNQILGVNVDYNVLVDFQAFQQAVDNVGGVDLNVPTDLVDPTMAWENNNNPVLAKAGEQTFNGSQALLYVRSRETSSDFARAARQRAVLVALANKIVTLDTLGNPIKISDLFSTLANNVQTDLSLTNVGRLYSIVKTISSTNIASIDLDSAPNQYVNTGNLNGQSIVLPTAGLFNYSAIQSFIRGQLKDPYIMKENAKVLVLNGTTTAGLATTLSNQLKSYGYNVIGAANTPHPGWTRTQIVDLNNQDTYTRHFLLERLHGTVTNHLPDPTISSNGADFVIIVGNDEASATQNQTR